MLSDLMMYSYIAWWSESNQSVGIPQSYSLGDRRNHLSCEVYSEDSSSLRRLWNWNDLSHLILWLSVEKKGKEREEGKKGRGERGKGGDPPQGGWALINMQHYQLSVCVSVRSLSLSFSPSFHHAVSLCPYVILPLPLPLQNTYKQTHAYMDA